MADRTDYVNHREFMCFAKKRKIQSEAEAKDNLIHESEPSSLAKSTDGSSIVSDEVMSSPSVSSEHDPNTGYDDSSVHDPNTDYDDGETNTEEQ